MGRRISTWSTSGNTGLEGRIYWDGMQYAFRSVDGTTYFDQQDWVGTERLRTNYGGTIVASFSSDAFGDGSNQTVTTSGADQDNSSFALLEYDPESRTDHAQYRQFGYGAGRWFSPDPYSGSYDMNNPQSLNRYNYTLSNPVSFNDPTGQLLGLPGGGAGVSACLSPTSNSVCPLLPERYSFGIF